MASVAVVPSGAPPSIEDFLQLENDRHITDFTVPISDDVDEKWLRNIVMGECSSEEKVAAIKNSKHLKKGKIVRWEIDDLGLPVVTYLANDQLLDTFEELSLYYQTGPGSPTFLTLDKLDSQNIRSMEFMFKHDRFKEGYCRKEIKPSLPEIDGFKIRNLGRDNFEASKTFKRDSQSINISYFVKLDDDLNIIDFNISLKIENDDMLEMKSTVNVKYDGEKYIPSADVMALSPYHVAVASNIGYANYHFGPDGSFESIESLGYKFNEEQIEKNRQFYTKLGINLPELTTREIGEMPSGMSEDITMIAVHDKLCAEFSANPLFRKSPTDAGFDYVTTIVNLARMATTGDINLPQLMPGSTKKLE